MTRVVLIEAGPTKWDAEDRLVGNQSLPLTPGAAAVVTAAVDQLEQPIEAVYRAGANEATDQAAAIVAKRFALRPRDNADLDELSLGLWQGLTHAEAKFRFPTAFEQWQKDPAAVRPPDGETVDEAVSRLRNALRKILRRNRDRTIALSLRPMAMQIVLGLLRGESSPTIAVHLHNHEGLATIEVSEEQIENLSRR
jgi:broad specificity phosphatase PhoE